MPRDGWDTPAFFGCLGNIFVGALEVFLLCTICLGLLKVIFWIWE